MVIPDLCGVSLTLSILFQCFNGCASHPFHNQMLARLLVYDLVNNECSSFGLQKYT